MPSCDGAAACCGATGDLPVPRSPFPVPRSPFPVPLLYQTPRLTVRRLALADALWIRDLVTEAGWLRWVGSRSVETVADAERYLREGPLASYEAHGHGLYRVGLRVTDAPIGICGILTRETLDAPDLGYAIFERHAGRGYATEAARATLDHAHRDLGLARVLAVTDPDNAASRRVLEKAGMRHVATMPLPGSDAPSAVFAADLGERPESAG